MGFIIYIIFGAIELLLSLRLLFRLFGANPGNPFVAWIYEVSAPFIAPFTGIFGQPPTFEEGAVVRGVFELATLVAIIVYGVVAAIIGAIFASIKRNTQA